MDQSAAIGVLRSASAVKGALIAVEAAPPKQLLSQGPRQAWCTFAGRWGLYATETSYFIFYFRSLLFFLVPALLLTFSSLTSPLPPFPPLPPLPLLIATTDPNALADELDAIHAAYQRREKKKVKRLRRQVRLLVPLFCVLWFVFCDCAAATAPIAVQFNTLLSPPTLRPGSRN